MAYVAGFSSLRDPVRRRQAVVVALPLVWQLSHREQRILDSPQVRILDRVAMPDTARCGRFARQIDTEKCGSPAALGVITGTGYGYVRDDGINVIPIGALRP